MPYAIQIKETGDPDVMKIINTEIREPGPGEVRIVRRPYICGCGHLRTMPDTACGMDGCDIAAIHPLWGGRGA